MRKACHVKGFLTPNDKKTQDLIVKIITTNEKYHDLDIKGILGEQMMKMITSFLGVSISIHKNVIKIKHEFICLRTAYHQDKYSKGLIATGGEGCIQFLVPL